jgi:hypothetical protein
MLLFLLLSSSVGGSLERLLKLGLGECGCVRGRMEWRVLKLELFVVAVGCDSKMGLLVWFMWFR